MSTDLSNESFPEKADWEITTEEDAAYEADMDNWSRLSKAVGGDLFDNPEKLAIMRQVDGDPANDGIPWQEFHARVVAAIQDAGLSIDPAEHPEPAGMD